MAKPLGEHEGKKYLRKIRGRDPRDPNRRVEVLIDIYDVIVCFAVTCPGRQQAIKKLLATGERGKGDQLADLIGADAALSRAIELQQDRRDANTSTVSHKPIVLNTHPRFEEETANRQHRTPQSDGGLIVIDGADELIPFPPPATVGEASPTTHDGTHV